MKYTLESSREFYNGQPGMRVSAAMIVKWHESYLMVKHDYKDVMTFPSGLNDQNESPLTTAIRETEEEIGLGVAKEKITFYSMTYIAEQNGFKNRLHFFFCTEIDDEQARSLKFEEAIESHEWVGPNDIAHRAGNRSVYTKLQSMLVTGTSEPYFES